MSKKYYDRLEKNLKKLETFEEFLKKDDIAEKVVNIARKVLNNPKDFQSTDWLLRNGSKLAAIYAYLEGKASQAKSEAEVAEITYDASVNHLLLENNKEGATVTAARADAKLEMEEGAIDVQVKKQQANYYSTCARAAEKVVSFIQTTLKQKEAERIHSRSQNTQQHEG